MAHLGKKQLWKRARSKETSGQITIESIAIYDKWEAVKLAQDFHFKLQDKGIISKLDPKSWYDTINGNKSRILRMSCYNHREFWIGYKRLIKGGYKVYCISLRGIK